MHVVQAVVCRDPQLLKRLGARPAVLDHMLAASRLPEGKLPAHLFFIDPSFACGPLEWAIDRHAFLATEDEA